MFDIKEIPINEIKILNRSRKELGDIVALSKDIEAVGLISPIAVNDEYRLLAGERRLTACKHLGHETILARIFPNLNEDDILMIEMLENTSREPFKWYEELEIKSKLHKYWMIQAKPAIWGYRETAEKMKVSLGGLSSDLALSEALKAFPELKEAETKRQAGDRYRKLIDQVKSIKAIDNLSDSDKANLAKMLGGKPINPIMDIPKARHADTTPDFATIGGGSTDEQPQSDKANDLSSESDPLNGELKKELPPHKYGIESWETFITQIPNNSIGLIELDPPYAIEFNEIYGKVKKIQAAATDWTTEQLQDCFRTMLPILYDKLLDNSWVICWTGKEHYQWINAGAASCGFKVQDPGIWAKKSGGSNTPKTNMISGYEMFLLFRKGNAQFNLNSFHSVINFDAPSSTHRIHQWEKPMEMYDYFLKQLGKPGSIFLSPFAGSGNSMVSAAINNMIPFGCDVNQKYIYRFYELMNNHFNKEV